jgi:hypothetical protein
MVVPIIPKATTNHGDLRFAVKKLSVVADLLVRCAITINIRKYPPNKEAIKIGLISVA